MTPSSRRCAMPWVKDIRASTPRGPPITTIWWAPPRATSCMEVLARTPWPHTVGMRDITYGDRNGDGVDDYSIITLYSNQGAGAHNGDDLGTIKVYGDLITADDVHLDAGVTYGAYNTLAEGPHMFEDDGVLVGGASDGGHHYEMA
jgi:hypothetical protein